MSEQTVDVGGRRRASLSCSPTDGSRPGRTLVTKDMRMRIGLAGTGRIGTFHASTLAALDAGRPGGRDRRLPGGRRAAGGRGRLRVRRRPRRAPRPGRRPGHHHVDRRARGHPAPRRRGRRHHLLREAGRPHAGGDRRARRARREERRPGPRGLPAALRRGLPAGPRGGPQRRAGLPAHRPGQHPRPGTAAGGVHPDQRRSLPRLQHPRLRHHPVRDRARGRRASSGSAPTRAKPSSPRAATSTRPPRC